MLPHHNIQEPVTFAVPVPSGFAGAAKYVSLPPTLTAKNIDVPVESAATSSASFNAMLYFAGFAESFNPETEASISISSSMLLLLLIVMASD